MIHIICLIGTIGSGKDVVASYLYEQGFTSFRLSDVVRNSLSAKNIPLTRETLQDEGNRLRREYGDDHLAKVIGDEIEKNNEEKVVIIGARNIAEPEFLQSRFPTLVCLYLDAPENIRRSRVISRQRREDIDSERSIEQAFVIDSMGVEPCKHLPYVRVIQNTGTIEELHAKIEQIIPKL